MLPLSRVPAASKAPPAHTTTSPAAISLRSSVLALTSDLQDFAPFAPETPSSPPGSRESNLAGRFLPTLCPAPGGPCYQPSSDYYCGLSKESSLESQGSSTLSSPSECLSAQPAGTPDCSPRGTSTATLFQFPISKILEEEEETTTGCPGHDHNCFQGEQAQEEPEERSPPPSEDACPPPSPCRPSPKRGPGDGPQGAEEIQRYRAEPVRIPTPSWQDSCPGHCLQLLSSPAVGPGPLLPCVARCLAAAQAALQRPPPGPRVQHVPAWVQLPLPPELGVGWVGVLPFIRCCSGDQAQVTLLPVQPAGSAAWGNTALLPLLCPLQGGAVGQRQMALLPELRHTGGLTSHEGQALAIAGLLSGSGKLGAAPFPSYPRAETARGCAVRWVTGCGLESRRPHCKCS